MKILLLSALIILSTVAQASQMYECKFIGTMNGMSGQFTKYHGPLRQKILDLSIKRDYHVNQFTGKVSNIDYDEKYITQLKGKYKKVEIIYMGQDNVDTFICRPKQ